MRILPTLSTTVNGEVKFICVNQVGERIESVQWRIDGQLLATLPALSDVMAQFDMVNRVGVLTFTMPPVHYHMFSIQCEATLEGSPSPILSDPQVLMVQGLEAIIVL